MKRGCDLLTLIFKNKIKRSQPAAAPTKALPFGHLPHKRCLRPHHLAAHQRQQHLIAPQLVLRHLHEVLVQDDQVGKLAHLDRARHFFQPELLGRIQGDGAQHLGTG
ncbi:hypothetical protein D3C84_1000530 [compost metagenome]